jgi:hypothetical protein
MSFYSVKTSSVISKHGSEIRRQINFFKRAKAKKNFVLKEKPDAEQQVQSEILARK